MPASQFIQVQAYSCPTFFRDDWLNAYYLQLRHLLPWAHFIGSTPASDATLGVPELAAATDAVDEGGSAQQADYRFAYVGLAGSRTMLHADVLRSYSWSANAAGTKRCTLLALR